MKGNINNHKNHKLINIFVSLLLVCCMVATYFLMPVKVLGSEAVSEEVSVPVGLSEPEAEPEAELESESESVSPESESESESVSPESEPESELILEPESEEESASPESESPEVEEPMILGEEGGIMPMSLGTTAISIEDKLDGKISNPSDFTLGSTNSTSFTISINVDTSEKESFRFVIPKGFSADIKNLDGFTLTQSTMTNGDIAYLYKANNTSAGGSYECTVTVDYADILAMVSDASPRTAFDFTSDIISEDESTTSPGTGFTINVPDLAAYSLEQVDTVDNNFQWTPYQLGGTTVNEGIKHSGNQADTYRPGVMTKRLQVEITKESGSTLQNDWSLDMPLPLYWKEVATNRYGSGYSSVYPKVSVYVNGQWKTMQSISNAFENLIYSNEYNAQSTPGYGLPTNMTATIYNKEQTLTLKNNLVTSMKTDTGLGVEKTIYEWFSLAEKIRVEYASDVMWDPVFDGQNPSTDDLSAAKIAGGTVTYNADDKTKLTAGGVNVTTPDPLKIILVNGSDTTLKVGIATIDEIKMGATTSKVTTESGSTYRNGYAAVFGTAKNNNYTYMTNMSANYEFPWEYSPTGTMTLCPLAANGNYNNERNLTCYDYELTISKTDGTDRVLSYDHLGYKDSVTHTPTNTGSDPYPSSIDLDAILGPDEWVSNVKVTASKIWKQNFTTDTSTLSSATENHPVFYANCTAKGTYVDGTNHHDGDQVDVKCTITTDQGGTVAGETKKVTLIGPRDNMIVWSKSEAAKKYPIGEYGDSQLEYMEIHLKKYTDTKTYSDPYIELTGDALALLNKITHKTNVGTVTNYLVLRGYQLNGGTWQDVNAAQAATLLDASGAYYDLSSAIPAGGYLTGLRLAPEELNNTTVDTVTTPTDTDIYDGTIKHYLDQTYYLYLYDKVVPGYLGYDDTLAHTYTNIVDLNSPLSYDISFKCDETTHTGTIGENHVKPGLSDNDKMSATLIYGDLPEKLYGRDNDYDIETSPSELTSGWKKYYVTELTNVAIDDGPASSSSINAWGEMKNATLKFADDTPDERRMLALTKGVSLIGSNWQGASYTTPESAVATVRYKTNLSGGWQTAALPAKTSGRDDRLVTYFTLGSGEYVTGVEIDYPEDFLFKAGYSTPGVENVTMRSQQISDVGLLTQGAIPKESPVAGEPHIFTNGETLDYHVELTYENMAGVTETIPLDYTTARLQPIPTMLVDDFASTVSYANASDHSSSYVYQGLVLNATLTHSYDFTNETKNIDTSKVIHPTLCYEIDKNFTVADAGITALASSLGISTSQITLTGKNDGSGNSILRIKFKDTDSSWTRDTAYTIVIPLTARPNAVTQSTKPIWNCWLSLDADKLLDPATEGEFIAVNKDSTQLETAPGNVLSDPDWATGTRLALTVPLTGMINVNKYQSSSMEFYGTNGSGGGIGTAVSGHDSTDSSIFGVGETLYAPGNPSKNWVIYVAVPTKDQTIPYGATETAASSDFSLVPAEALQLDNIAGTNFSVMYYIPATNSDLVPSMKGLDVLTTDTVTTIEGRDSTEDTGKGIWMTWDQVVAAGEQNDITYVRIVADNVAAGAELSSMLLMKLHPVSKKTQVDDMHAYTSIVYNYVNENGSVAFPTTEPSNRQPYGGKGSNYVKYTLTDFIITGQLWQEKNFNNTYTTGDVLTKDYMSVVLRDGSGAVIYHKDGVTPVTVEIKPDGTYSVKAPSHGDYYLTLEATKKDWKPVAVNADTINNGMKFNHSQTKGDGTVNSEQESTAKITITNADISNINGGIEQWGSLTVTKDVKGAYADLTKKYEVIIVPQSIGLSRSYLATVTPASGTATTISLNPGDNNNKVNLGKGDMLTVSLPVGLKYTIKETDAQYTMYVTTLENGDKPGDISANPYEPSGKTMENTMVEIKYDGENSKGGNKEEILNVKQVVTPTGVTVPGMSGGLILSILAVIFGIMFYWYKKTEERKRKRLKSRIKKRRSDMVKRVIKSGMFVGAFLCLSGIKAEAASVTTMPIDVSETVAGDVPDSMENFQVTLKRLASTSPMPAGSVGDTASISISGNTTGSFGGITYTSAGQYDYQIMQTVGLAAGYTYDTRIYEVTVYVANDSGNLKTQIVIKDNATGLKVSAIKFYNTYRATAPPAGTGNLRIQMSISGTFPVSDKIEVLIEFDNTGTSSYFYTDLAGNILGSIRSGDKIDMGDGDVFIILGLPAGTNYKVTQTPKAYYSPTPAVGILTGGITAGTVARVDLINVYDTSKPAPAIMDPPIQKQVSGSNAPTDSLFRFQMQAENPSNPMPKGASGGTLTKEIKGPGSVEMGWMTYDTAGSYVYYLKELDTNLDGYTYDTIVYTMTVTVKDESGILKASKTIVNADKKQLSQITFVNRYDGSGSDSNGGGSNNEGSSGNKANPVTQIIKAVQTGDVSKLLPYVGLLTGAVLIMIILIVLKKKYRKKEDNDDTG